VEKMNYTGVSSERKPKPAERLKAFKAEIGGGVLGSKPPSHHLGGLRSAVSSTSVVRDGVPTNLRLSCILEASDGLS